MDGKLKVEELVEKVLAELERLKYSYSWWYVKSCVKFQVDWQRLQGQRCFSV